MAMPEYLTAALFDGKSLYKNRYVCHRSILQACNFLVVCTVEMRRMLYYMNKSHFAEILISKDGVSHEYYGVPEDIAHDVMNYLEYKSFQPH